MNYFNFKYIIFLLYSVKKLKKYNYYRASNILFLHYFFSFYAISVYSFQFLNKQNKLTTRLFQLSYSF